MTAYAYIRVSTDAQDCANQRHGVELYAAKQNFQDVVFFEDTVSGKKSWRDRLLGQLMTEAKAGDVLIVSEISRLARSTLQVLEVLQEAAEIGLSVHVVKSNMIMDGSLNSRITAVVLGLAAEIEREFISARTTEALARRKAAGFSLGRPKGTKNLVHKLDPSYRQISEMLARGEKKSVIARTMKVTPQTLYDWLKLNGFIRYIKVRDKPRQRKKKPAEGGS